MQASPGFPMALRASGMTLSRLGFARAGVDRHRVLQPFDLARALVFLGDHLAPFRRVEALGRLARFPEIDAATLAAAEYVIFRDQARCILVGREVLLVELARV